MVELIVLGLLAYGFYQYKAVNVTLRILLFVFSVLGLLILLKVGFVAPFLGALISIPIDFISGLFGIIYHLLLG